MRIGVNPEKNRETKLIHKRHRIIIPFWIPNVEDEYFKNQPKVLHLCLKSIIETVDFEQTNITLINNNSCTEASKIAEEFVNKGLIDKYVIRNENRGKLENILAEARASYEDFITISDSDFLYFPGWENAVFNILDTFPFTGMVSCYPAAHLAYFYNSNFILHRFKSGKIISDEDIDMFERGHGHPINEGLYSSIKLKQKYSWREKHYYIEKNNQIAILGAVHALATFRKEVAQKFNTKPVNYVFKNGYEVEYIDFSIERNGYLRVSTPTLFAYHLGNTIPEDLQIIYEKRKNNWNNDKQTKIWKQTRTKKRKSFHRLIFPFTNILFRGLRKFKLI